FFCITIPRPPLSTLFPYTTLFRSNNLEVTNNLDIQPEVRCRVLLTSTLESFTIGHTIVLSRGLIDVLPDEASLATMVAHELGHRSEEHTSELQSPDHLVCRLLLEK